MCWGSNWTRNAAARGGRQTTGAKGEIRSIGENSEQDENRLLVEKRLPDLVQKDRTLTPPLAHDRKLIAREGESVGEMGRRWVGGLRIYLRQAISHDKPRDAAGARATKWGWGEEDGGRRDEETKRQRWRAERDKKWIEGQVGQLSTVWELELPLMQAPVSSTGLDYAGSQ